MEKNQERHAKCLLQFSHRSIEISRSFLGFSLSLSIIDTEFFLFVTFQMFLLSSTFVDLGGQMQRLNNNRQFKQSIALFDAHTEKQPNAFAVNQALKACIQLDDINRGIQIHHNLPSSFV